jgi:osmoprotectant transport system permease protein
MSSTDTLDRSQDEAVAESTIDVSGETGQPTWKKVVHYAGMPAFVVLVLVLLYLYVQGQQLDSVAQRSLTTDAIRDNTLRHIQLTVLSTLGVLLTAVPLGIVVTRPWARRVAPFVIGLGNAGQAIPSLGMLGVLFLVFFLVPALPATGLVPVVVALIAYSFLPILRNTIVGLEQVDPSVLEAGRGMGMPNRRILRRIELPLAVPVILAGVRTALVLNVGTATLAFLFGGGGLGQTIFSGFQLQRTPVMVTGAVLTAALALLIDYLGGLAEELLSPKGL